LASVFSIILPIMTRMILVGMIPVKNLLIAPRQAQRSSLLEMSQSLGNALFDTHRLHRHVGGI
jgi:hypothetical protein